MNQTSYAQSFRNPSQRPKERPRTILIPSLSETHWEEQAIEMPEQVKWQSARDARASQMANRKTQMAKPHCLLDSDLFLGECHSERSEESRSVLTPPGTQGGLGGWVEQRTERDSSLRSE